MRKNRKRRGSFLLFLFYLAVLLRITVFRTDFGVIPLFQNGRIEISWFSGYRELLDRGEWFSFTYLFVGNVIWFVPFGMYLCRNRPASREGRGVWPVVLCGFLFSLLIETMQYIFGTGCSDLDDLILNTCGVWLGAAWAARHKRAGHTGRSRDEASDDS